MDCPTIQRIQKLFNFVEKLSDELGTLHTVLISPNPNKGNFDIFFHENMKSERFIALVQIFNLIGQEVYKKEQIVYDGMTILSNIKINGIYYLKLGGKVVSFIVE